MNSALIWMQGDMIISVCAHVVEMCVRSGTRAVMAAGLMSGRGHSGCRRLFDVRGCFEALSKHLKGQQVFLVHAYIRFGTDTNTHWGIKIHLYTRIKGCTVIGTSFSPSRGRLFQDSQDTRLGETLGEKEWKEVVCFIIELQAYKHRCVSQMTHLCVLWMY